MGVVWYMEYGNTILNGIQERYFTDAQCWIWYRLKALASMSQRTGYLEWAPSIPYSDMEQIAFAIHRPHEVGDVRFVVETCLEIGLLVKNGSGALIIGDWDATQTVKAGKTWEDVRAERRAMKVQRKITRTEYEEIAEMSVVRGVSAGGVGGDGKSSGKATSLSPEDFTG